MASFELTMVSPLPVYDEITTGCALASRPASLDGKVVGLLPNLRPAALPILKAIGTLLEQRYRLKSVVMEEPVRESTRRTTKMNDAMRAQLDDLARRVDVVVVATAD